MVDLPPIPPRIAALPRDERGYPVPAFVAWIDGKPEFRCMDSSFLGKCVREKLCWVCGGKLGKHQSFVIGPMCTINRVSAEPPSHLECATFSVKACPFLTKPNMRRNEHDLPEGTREAPGVMIRRNPGVSCIWTVIDYQLIDAGNGILFTFDTPHSVSWWSEGRRATRSEVIESMESGLPLLLEQCQGKDDLAALDKMRQAALHYLPEEADALPALLPGA
jgi:hypothetical protein